MTTSGADTIFIIIVALAGFIMGAVACRDIEIVIEARKKDDR